MTEQSARRAPWHLTEGEWRFVVRNDTRDADSQLRWNWRVTAPGGMSWEGDEGFATRALCEADAVTHGFVRKDRPAVVARHRP